MINKLMATLILRLWNEYTYSKEAREEINILNGLPVFNAVNFMYWLKNKYGKK